MADKKAKKKKEVKPAEKKLEGVLERHPDVRSNARGYFRNENGKTIVQERVPRGDLPQDAVIMPRTEADLTDDDIRKIAKEAKSRIDPLLEKYDSDAAMQDAMMKAVWSMGDGMYQNRVGASTQALILDVMKGGGKKSKEASDDAEAADIDTLIESIPVTSGGAGGGQPKGKAPQEAAPPKEAMMDKEALRKEAASLSKKLDALKVLLDDEGDGDDVEACEKFAGSKKGPGVPDGTGPFGGTDECQMSKKESGKEPEEPGEDESKESEKSKEEPETAEASVVGAIDEIAEMVEKEARDKEDLDLFRIAFQLDCVSDYLSGEKDAAVLQSDPDEDFMRKAFHAGAPEKDADEPYMKEYDTDLTTQVAGVVGKTAASLPYPVKRD